MPEILIKRAYEAAARGDGYRVLVDRLWPRGLTKQELPLDQWDKDLAPTTELRKWFGHEPERWAEFQKRYRKELSSPEQRGRMRELLENASPRALTLVYGAKDEEHTHALVLQAELKKTAGAGSSRQKAGRSGG
ncbi:MAG TPA: DUF488 family protein [Steroidobacteraceae bacterium]|nr:DUF488 family protein [Steroidobacteraceae bacterium]